MAEQRVTTVGASVLANDVATPVPEAVVTAVGVSLIAVDLATPGSGGAVIARAYFVGL